MLSLLSSFADVRFLVFPTKSLRVGDGFCPAAYVETEFSKACTDYLIVTDVPMLVHLAVSGMLWDICPQFFAPYHMIGDTLPDLSFAVSTARCVFV
jgi:hypothetical protein